MNCKRNLDIVQQGRDGTTLRRLSPSRQCLTHVGTQGFVASDWDNKADETVIESAHPDWGGPLTYLRGFFELVRG